MHSSANNGYSDNNTTIVEVTNIMQRYFDSTERVVVTKVIVVAVVVAVLTGVVAARSAA